MICYGCNRKIILKRYFTIYKILFAFIHSSDTFKTFILPTPSSSIQASNTIAIPAGIRKMPKIFSGI